MNYKFLLFGVGVGQNYGCDAIVIGTERILRRQFPDCQTWLYNRTCRRVDCRTVAGPSSRVVFKGNDFGSRLAHCGRRIPERLGLLRQRVLSYPRRLVNASDCVLSIGGDLYTFAENEKNWMFPYPIMEAGNRVMRQGRPYVVWCASVGPLEKAGGRLDELRSHLEACRAIIVREQETYSYLRETLGIHENVYLGADPAFVMNPEPFACRFLEQKPGGTVLAVNFSLAPLQHVYGDLPVRELQATLARHVRAILDSLDVRVMFVPHVQGDYGFLSAVLQSLGGAYSDRLYILPEGVGAQRTKWAVSRARALLTMRFHCSLAGFSTNTPTMILVSTPKGAKICKEMYGDLEHALHIREMTEETLVCGVRKLLDDAEGIRARLAPASEKMARRAFACGEMLAHVLADNLPIGWNCPPEVPHPDLTSCSARWSLTEGRSA